MEVEEFFYLALKKIFLWFYVLLTSTFAVFIIVRLYVAHASTKCICSDLVRNALDKGWPFKLIILSLAILSLINFGYAFKSIVRETCWPKLLRWLKGWPIFVGANVMLVVITGFLTITSFCVCFSAAK